MKVTTPSISWHDRERISSVDFQPTPWPPPSSGTSSKCRLASAGDDHHVVIWDVAVAEDGKITLSCLCDLSRHQNTVNVVRWSKDGRILASGDTDNAIFLWHHQDKECAPDIFGDDIVSNAAAASNGGGESAAPVPVVAAENWSPLRTLRGHLQDVISLSFSPCGNFLVSGSTDSTAIVFDVNKGTKLKILSDHKGWVNGVAWDPLHKFVASIASDRVLRLFKTKSYKPAVKTYKCKLSIGVDPETGKRCEERGVRLFHDDTFQSFYRRMEFSPDGEILVVPSGVLEVEGEAKIANCTYLFSRMDFTKPVMYLPNKEFSVAVRFSPIKYKLRQIPLPQGAAATDTKEMAIKVEDESTETLKPWEKTQTLFRLPYRMVYAVATQNTVMLYDTQQAEPFARVSKIHYIGLTDLSWSSDGTILTVSSSDGFCSLITFKEEEIGEIFNDKENEESNATIVCGEKMEKLDDFAMDVDEPEVRVKPTVVPKKATEVVTNLISVRR